jgi:hypothetical protein
MARLITCDRCGKNIENEGTVHVLQVERQGDSEPFVAPRDFCPDCARQIKLVFTVPLDRSEAA